jgi:poly(A) polymerase
MMMTPATRIPVQDWMSDPATQTVRAPLVDGLPDQPMTLFVGGCVRDALLGRPVVDVDMATVHGPEEVMRRLDEAGIGYHTIGAEHGTVAAHRDGRVFEITTLRVDVETDGRHARVAYTDDWALDASRRDFTINALYADADGNVFDPLGGMPDIKARRVRFIGDPNERIQEDALRILRFFRFHAQLGEGALDHDGLAACQARAGLLEQLSGERVRDEFFKLLRSDQPATTLAVLHNTGILGRVLPVSENVGRLTALVAVEEGATAHADPLRRLAALLDHGQSHAQVAARLRLSRADASRLRSMLERPNILSPDLEAGAARHLLHDIGATNWVDLVLLNWAAAMDCDGAAERLRTEQWRTLCRLPETAPVPPFPLRGADVLDLGLPEGPEVRRLLEEVEAWWMEGDFEADRDACLAELARRARGLSGSGGQV